MIRINERYSAQNKNVGVLETIESPNTEYWHLKEHAIYISICTRCAVSKLSKETGIYTSECSFFSTIVSCISKISKILLHQWNYLQHNIG